jgi:hypothetical protein
MTGHPDSRGSSADIPAVRGDVRNDLAHRPRRGIGRTHEQGFAIREQQHEWTKPEILRWSVWMSNERYTI